MALPALSITRAYKELTQHDGNGHVLTRKNANTRQRRFFFFFFFCPNECIGRRILKNSAPENAPFWQFERDGITAAVEFETTLSHNMHWLYDTRPYTFSDSKNTNIQTRK